LTVWYLSKQLPLWISTMQNVQAYLTSFLLLRVVHS